MIVTPPPGGKKSEHTGIKIELLGQVEMYHDKGNFHDFANIVRELEFPGILQRDVKEYPFNFSLSEMKNESYMGLNVRYMLRQNSFLHLLILKAKGIQ